MVLLEQPCLPKNMFLVISLINEVLHLLTETEGVEVNGGHTKHTTVTPQTRVSLHSLMYGKV